MSIQCDKCGKWVDALPIHKCRQTPKGEPMPQTVEEWRYLYGLAEQGMIEDKATISKLKHKINQLEQRK